MLGLAATGTQGFSCVSNATGEQQRSATINRNGGGHKAAAARLGNCCNRNEQYQGQSWQQSV